MAAAGEGSVPCAQPPEHPSTPCARPWWPLTVLSLAAGAHTLAGGQLPSPGILLALLALTGLASTTATRLKLNLPALAGLLGAGQLVLHEAFTAFSGPALSPALAGAVSGPGDRAHHVGPVPLPAGIGSTLAAPGLDSGPALLMLAGHALATLLCAVLLARGEAALWAAGGVAPPAAPAPCSGDARRRRGPGSRWLARGVRTAAVAEPPARLPPRAARRRRLFLTSSRPRPRLCPDLLCPAPGPDHPPRHPPHFCAPAAGQRTPERQPL